MELTINADQAAAAAALLLPNSEAILHVFVLALIAASVLSPLESLVPAHRQNVLFRKGLVLDICYWFMTPLVTRFFTGVMLGGVFLLGGLLLGFRSFDPEALTSGFGPLSRQPHWLQAIEILLLADFVDYWSHRTFHSRRLWPVHAIHHSPEEMSWLSSSRVHPLNDLVTRSCQVIPILGLGFSASAILSVVPYISFYVMFLHSNIRWDFGWFRWILVSPAYHRWHHTSDTEGVDKNYAGIFPIWDVIFGTCYFPHALPRRYGVNGQTIPESLIGQLIFPFTRVKR